jgi:hypothetical protein
MRGVFDDGVEAVVEEAGAHGVGVFVVGEGADLDMEELVLGLGADDDGVAAALEGGDEEVGVFLVGNGGDLDDGAGAGNHGDGRGGDGCGRWCGGGRGGTRSGCGRCRCRFGGGAVGIFRRGKGHGSRGGGVAWGNDGDGVGGAAGFGCGRRAEGVARGGFEAGEGVAPLRSGGGRCGCADGVVSDGVPEAEEDGAEDGQGKEDGQDGGGAERDLAIGPLSVIVQIVVAFAMEQTVHVPGSWEWSGCVFRSAGRSLRWVRC